MAIVQWLSMLRVRKSSHALPRGKTMQAEICLETIRSDCVANIILRVRKGMEMEREERLERGASEQSNKWNIFLYIATVSDINRSSGMMIICCASRCVYLSLVLSSASFSTSKIIYCRLSSFYIHVTTPQPKDAARPSRRFQIYSPHPPPPQYNLLPQQSRS